MVKSTFHNVRHITIGGSKFSPAILLNLISTLEHVSELHLQGCEASPAPEGCDSLPNLPSLRGHLSISDPRTSIINLLSHLHLPLHSLSHASRALPPENKVIDACAASLENLEIRMVINWGV